MTTETMTLRERAIAAYQANEAAYAAAQELRHREDAKRDEQRLAMLLGQTLGVEDVEIIPAGAPGAGPTAFVGSPWNGGLTFALIRTVGGDHDLGVLVPCPRCGEDILEKLPWVTGGAERDKRGLIVLGDLLINPEGHRGRCPKDLDEDGEPKDRPALVAEAVRVPTGLELIAEGVRALIHEEMEKRGA